MRKERVMMERKFSEILTQNRIGKLLTAVVGTAIYAFGMNVFIVPLGLYSGGLMGVAQLLRTSFNSVLGLNVAQFDIAGLLNYVLNIPMIILAWKKMDGAFLRKMLIAVTTCTVFLSIIPIPKTPVIQEELTGTLMGGIICGVGIGLYLRAGYSGGGVEVLGLYLTRIKPNFSVGKINIWVNIVIYGVCLLLFDPTITVYSIIYTVFMCITMDRLHAQNIPVEALILSKVNNDVIEQQVLKRLSRGLTCWKAKGGYTAESVDVLYIVLSKYEIDILRDIVYTANPNAFVVMKEGLSVEGNFIKRL